MKNILRSGHTSIQGLQWYGGCHKWIESRSMGQNQLDFEYKAL